MDKFKEQVLLRHGSLVSAIRYFSEKHFGRKLPSVINSKMRPKKEEADMFHIISHICCGYFQIDNKEVYTTLGYARSSTTKACMYCDDKLRTSRSFNFKYYRFLNYLKEKLYE